MTDAPLRQLERQLDGASVQVFTSGDGAKWGLVSLKDREGVIVFRRHLDGVWRGAYEFSAKDSTSIWPGDAIPEIAAELNDILFDGDRTRP